MVNIRDKIVNKIVKWTLKWEKKFGVAPRITASISEYDAAMLKGMTVDEYSEEMRDKTAVREGYDFEYKGIKYQVKGNRPSGKKGSKVSKLPKAKMQYKKTNSQWDKLIWILYNENFEMQEAWEWDFKEYEKEISNLEHVRPEHMRRGKRIFSKL